MESVAILGATGSIGKSSLDVISRYPDRFTVYAVTANSRDVYKRQATSHLKKGRVVIFAAGTGNPFFTTDTAAALRSAEIGADMVLKATQVDGVFTADPKKDPSAKMYKSLTFDEAIQKKLKILDATAFTLCRDQGMPIRVFNLHKPGALKRVVLGEDEGTLVHV